MLRVGEIINRCAVIGEQFSYYVNRFKAAFDALNHVYLKYDPDFYTEQLQEANTTRAYEFRRLREMIRYQSLYADSDEKKLVAGRLLKITDLYGGSSIPDQNMSSMTASITNLVEDFDEKHQSELELLGIAGLLVSLKQAQQEFDRIYMDRLEFNAENGKAAMEEARRVMDSAYHDLVTMVNMGAKRDTEGALDEFINLMNVEIGTNRTYTGQGQVGSTTGSGTGSEDEDGMRVKNATFEFRNGDQVKLRVEVGTPLVAPSNTEGYMWKPEVPELMPAKNLTFREVPIEEREAVATFHFFDHTEEEIRQVVGSALTAPANTEGYYWDPTVPATMPEEDTSYYELPVEQEEGGGQEEEEEYTVTYHNDNGEVITTQRYKVGQTIVPPTPPAGFEWGYLPIVMPARDLNIYPIDSETGA